MIEQHIRDFLRDDVDITNRVGANIWPGRALEFVKGEMLIVSAITSIPEYTISGEAGKASHVVQIIGDDDASSVERCEIVSGGAGEVAPEDKSDNWTFTYRHDYALFQATTIPTLV